VVEKPPLSLSLADAVSVFRGNPFTDNAVASRARLGRLLLTPPAARAFRGALRGSVPYGAEDLVLAIAHARASALLDPEAVLSAAVVPDTVLAELPRSRLDYTRIALAAARVFRALQAISGRSRALARVRHDAWNRAFGHSLVDALDTEPLRRDQPILVSGEPGSGRATLARAVLSGLPGPAGRPPWTAPTVTPWSPSGAPAPAGGLLVEGLAQRTPLELEALYGALRRSGGPRLAITCGPWAQVAPRLPRVLATRLAPQRLVLPPLRDRPEDLVPLAQARLVTWGGDLRDAGCPGLDHDPVLAWFDGAEASHHDWPGNGGEVDAAVQALVLGTRPSLAATVAPDPRRSAESLPGGLADGTWSDRQVRDWYLARVHRLTGRVGRTASILGLDRSTVRLRLREGTG
jgi:hypothetical protein